MPGLPPAIFNCKKYICIMLRKQDLNIRKKKKFIRQSSNFFASTHAQKKMFTDFSTPAQ